MNRTLFIAIDSQERTKEKSQFTYWQYWQIKKNSGQGSIWIKNEPGHNHGIKDSIKNSFQLLYFYQIHCFLLKFRNICIFTKWRETPLKIYRRPLFEPQWIVLKCCIYCHCAIDGVIPFSFDDVNIKYMMSINSSIAVTDSEVTHPQTIADLKQFQWCIYWRMYADEVFHSLQYKPAQPYYPWAPNEMK